MIIQIRDPRRAEIYISCGRHTAEQVRRLTGADVVINGGLYDMKTMLPNCHLRVRGVDHAADRYNYVYGYGWPEGTAKLAPVESRNKATVDYYICDSWMVTSGRAVEMVYDSAQGGCRGNTAIGVDAGGSIIVNVHRDVRGERVTPEQLQQEMLDCGCVSALRLDGGGSSQLSTLGHELTSPVGRRVHNYICIWGNVSKLDTTTEEKEENTMTEYELRRRVLAAAMAWQGKNEADGSHKEIIDIYNAYKPLPVGYKVKYTDEWCATFVSAVFIQCGLTDIAPPECSCERMISLHKALGTWQEKDDHRPDVGDLIFYDWQDSGSGDCTGWADHVGIVAEVNGDTITVIEGNRADAVGYRTVAVNGKTIRGYALPDYAGKAASSVIEPESPDSWAAAACGKAVAKGVIQGDGQGHYGWTEPVTIQQLMVVLERLSLL